MANIYDMADTWNDGGTTFTAIKMDVTDTASASGSLLMDLQVGSTSKFKVEKTGSIVANVGTNQPYLKTQFSNYHLQYDGNGGWEVVLNGTPRLTLAETVSMGSVGALRWTSVLDSGTTPDLLLTRKSAANLRFGAADAGTSATVTISSANPGVVTWSNHGLSTGSPVKFTTTGTLPTNIVAGTVYYAIYVNSNTFQLATSFANALAGTAIDTSGGSPSGTHTGYKGAVAQKLSVQSSSTIENFPGADMVIEGSQGTGTGAGGSIIFKVASAGTTGTAQNGLVEAFRANSNRQLYFPSIGANDVLINWQYPGYGIGSNNNAETLIYIANNHRMTLGTNVIMSSIGAIKWTSGIPTATQDTILLRDAPNTLALRNGGTKPVPVPQTFNIYNYWDSASDYERGFMRWNSNVLEIGTEAAGSGTGRDLGLRSATTNINLNGNGLFWNTTGRGIGMGTTSPPGSYNTIYSAGNIELWHASGDAVTIRESSGFSNGARLSFLTSGNALHAALSTQNAGVLRLSGATDGAAFELVEQTAPAAPATNNVRIYAEDDGAGKTRLMALFPTGAAQQIAIEP